MKTISRYIMTLALLITAVGGAWADETPLLTIESKDYTDFLSGSKTFDDKVTVTFSSSVENNGDADGWFSIAESLLTVAGTNGYTITSCKFYTNSGTAKTGYTVAGESPSVYLSAGMVFTDASETVYLGDPGITKIEVYGAAEPTEWSLKPDETGKKWTLDKMPASNIELQVEYYAESNLFLGKEALADKANIAVKNGETAVDFGDDGKSTTIVTEGNTVTAKFTGKKVLGMKVEKGGGEPVLLTTITAADNSSFKSGSQTFGDVATVTLTGNWLTNDGSHGGWYCTGSNLTATISVAEANGAKITSVKFYTAGGGSAEDKEAPFEVTTTSMSSSDITTYLNGNAIGSYGVSKIEVFGTK